MKIDAVIRLIKTLRGPDGCPWDRKQTPRTISLYLVEEIFELLDAIESGAPDAVCEELGDVLFRDFFVKHVLTGIIANQKDRYIWGDSAGVY